jgi:glycosyltransferase involved in cell wall biosynthesis
MTGLKISIVTICFNNAGVIRRTIESVTGQDYPDIEYIVVDGGSTDGSLDIIKEYELQIATLISEPDKNLYDAINKGMKAATGDVVGLIHAGDRLFNGEVIRKIADYFTDNDIDVMYGHSILVNESDVPVRVNKSPAYRRSLVKRGWMPSHQSIYIRRSLLDKIGYYNLDLHPSSDYEFFLRYFYFHTLKIKRLDEFILRFSMGGISTRNYLNNIRSQEQQMKGWTINGVKPPFYLVPLKLARKPRQFVLAALYRLTGKYKKL